MRGRLSVSPHQVLLLMSADPLARKGRTVAWPPEPEVVAAAGGVGFGTSRFNKDAKPPLRDTKNDDDDDRHHHEDVDEKGRRTRKLVVVAEDVSIPPMLRYLHPKLSASVYARYRKDPLFLYKTTPVCEDCYLVFAEMASAPSLSSALLRQRSLPSPPPYSSSMGSKVDWATAPLPGPSTTSFSQPSSLKSTRRAQRSSVDEVPTAPPSGPPPSIPKAIYNSTDIAGALEASYGSVQSSDSGSGDGTGGAGGVSVEEMIQAREDAFFKEIAQQPSLRRGHPLTHLVAAQNKLESVSAAAEHGLATSSAGGTRKGNTITLNGTSPYAQPTSLSVVTRSDQGPTSKKQTRAEKNRTLDGSRKGGAASQALNGAMAEASSSHREFLLSTLNEVQHQLTTPDALKAFVESHTSKGGGGGMQAEEESESESELDEEEAMLDAQAQVEEMQGREATMIAQQDQHAALTQGLVNFNHQQDTSSSSSSNMATGAVDNSTELMRTAFHVEGRYLAVKVRRIIEAANGPLSLSSLCQPMLVLFLFYLSHALEECSSSFSCSHLSHPVYHTISSPQSFRSWRSPF